MLLHIPNVLTSDQVHELRARLAASDWIDGRQAVRRATPLAALLAPLIA